MTDITMHSMFERFSSGYYLGTVRGTPRRRAGRHQRVDHEHVNEQLYADGEGLSDFDAPRDEGWRGHIPVSGDDDDVPGRRDARDSYEIADDTLPDRRNVLLADADRARPLLRWEGWEPFANA